LCLEHYAHGLSERWCDRYENHDGPCSGDADPPDGEPDECLEGYYEKGA